jgi:hypothetical protein
MVSIRRDARGLRRGDCWECQAPGTPILDRVRPSWLFVPSEGRVGGNGLGVTLCRAYSRQRRSNPVRVRRSVTGFNYCLVAWGGVARYWRTRRNRSVPSLIPPVTTIPYQLKLLSRTRNRVFERGLFPKGRIHPAAKAARILFESI